MHQHVERLAARRRHARLGAGGRGEVAGRVGRGLALAVDPVELFLRVAGEDEIVVRADGRRRGRGRDRARRRSRPARASSACAKLRAGRAADQFAHGAHAVHVGDDGGKANVSPDAVIDACDRAVLLQMRTTSVPGRMSTPSSPASSLERLRHGARAAHRIPDAHGRSACGRCCRARPARRRASCRHTARNGPASARRAHPARACGSVPATEVPMRRLSTSRSVARFMPLKLSVSRDALDRLPEEEFVGDLVQLALECEEVAVAGRRCRARRLHRLGHGVARPRCRSSTRAVVEEAAPLRVEPDAVEIVSPCPARPRGRCARARRGRSGWSAPCRSGSPAPASTAALPPSQGFLSNRMTLWPRAARVQAAASPPSPPPTTPMRGQADIPDRVHRPDAPPPRAGA